jgi:hypothetical protein
VIWSTRGDALVKTVVLDKQTKSRRGKGKPSS